MHLFSIYLSNSRLTPLLHLAIMPPLVAILIIQLLIEKRSVSFCPDHSGDGANFSRQTQWSALYYGWNPSSDSPLRKHHSKIFKHFPVWCLLPYLVSPPMHMLCLFLCFSNVWPSLSRKNAESLVCISPSLYATIDANRNNIFDRMCPPCSKMSAHWREERHCDGFQEGPPLLFFASWPLTEECWPGNHP